MRPTTLGFENSAKNSARRWMSKDSTQKAEKVPSTFESHTRNGLELNAVKGTNAAPVPMHAYAAGFRCDE